ncbi:MULTISPECIES: BLUF domain-containing protein [Variovorax]|uniref:BLUF domain-containing protein n=1 Tax=Variovorax TaxID=34072 RepID=UPI000BB3944D|nr:BLUF domain-containing protein [Variovorax boronicumulans]PBI91335.1 Blue light- and temperature-regulated antirepressor YcgF [Variovorax boronicumulans]
MTQEQASAELLYEFLYCSLLAPDLPPATVGAIVTQARARNAEDGISGLLVFDGQCFCQHFEGPREAVQALMARLQRDPRHVALVVVHDGPLAARRYSGFAMGLAECEGPDPVSGLRALRGEAALAHFLALRASFDIST